MQANSDPLTDCGNFHRSCLWTQITSSYDLFQIGPTNKNILDMVASMASESPLEASAFFGISTKFAEHLGNTWIADRQYLDRVQMGQKMPEERPMSRVYQRLGFTTALLFKFDNEEAFLDVIRSKRSLPSQAHSPQKIHFLSFYINFIKHSLARPLFACRHFCRILFGLRPLTLASIHRCDDYLLNQASFFSMNLKLRVREQYLETLLTSNNKKEIARTRVQILMSLLTDIPQDKEFSRSSTIRHTLRCAPFDPLDAEEFSIDMQFPASMVFDEAKTSEIFQVGNRFDIYSQPYIATYILMIFNGVHHALATKFFSEAHPSSSTTLLTIRKHLERQGINTSTKGNHKIVNNVGYTLATLFTQTYFSYTNGAKELKPLLFLSCFHFFKLQICEDLPEHLKNLVHREWTANKAAKLILLYSQDKVQIHNTNCRCCNNRFWHITNTKPLCPQCQL